jgi:hypothetical protein
MAQEWTTPAMSAAPPQPARSFELRPLSLGEILDRTFAVYRSRFWLFAGLASIYGAMNSAAAAVQATLQHEILVHMGTGPAQVAASGSTGLVVLLAVPVVAVAQAAILFALSEVYLGRGTTVGAALRAVIGRWYRWIGVILWQGWSLVWVPLLVMIPAFAILGLGLASWTWLAVLLILLGVVGGGVYGVIAYLRNSLALAAAVLEQSAARASMRRSKVLTSGAKGRVFVVGLVVYAMYMVAGVLQMPLAFMILQAPLEPHIVAHAITLLVGFVAATVVLPVGMIGLGLIYFDQRVRQEGFDLLVMMGPETPEAPQYAEASLDPADPIGADGRL